MRRKEGPCKICETMLFDGNYICKECTEEMLYNCYYNSYQIDKKTHERAKRYDIDRKAIRAQARADKKMKGWKK